MKEKDMAMHLCQKFGSLTMWTDFNEGMSLPLSIAKKCAVCCVEEIMESNGDFAYSHNTWNGSQTYRDSEKYWQEVKSEIEKL